MVREAQIWLDSSWTLFPHLLNTQLRHLFKQTLFRSHSIENRPQLPWWSRCKQKTSKNDQLLLRLLVSLEIISDESRKRKVEPWQTFKSPTFSGLQTADLKRALSRPGKIVPGTDGTCSNWQILTNKLAHFEQFRYYMTIYLAIWICKRGQTIGFQIPNPLKKSSRNLQLGEVQPDLRWNRWCSSPYLVNEPNNQWRPSLVEDYSSQLVNPSKKVRIEN